MATYITKEKAAEKLKAMPAKKIIGSNVVNLKEKKLGEIHDLAIDMESGNLSYAVLKSGKKLFAIPWEAFRLKSGESFIKGSNRDLVLNIPEEAIKDSQGFNEEYWPTEPDRAWLEQVYKNFGVRPYWEQTKPESTDTMPPPENK